MRCYCTFNRRRLLIKKCSINTTFLPVYSDQMSLVPAPAFIYSRWFVVARTTHFRVCETFKVMGLKLKPTVFGDGLEFGNI